MGEAKLENQTRGPYDFSLKNSNKIEVYVKVHLLGMQLRE